MIDMEATANAVRAMLAAIGEDVERPGLVDTPARVARMWAELLQGAHEDPTVHLQTTFEIDHSEGVAIHDIEFVSLCEHHLLPFVGTVNLYYVPGRKGRFPGLSKLARLVDGYARRLQVQERMTSQIADAIVNSLGAEGAAVSIKAEHMCMSIRGVKKPGAKTITTATRGSFTTSPEATAAALRMVGI